MASRTYFLLNNFYNCGKEISFTILWWYQIQTIVYDIWISDTWFQSGHHQCNGYKLYILIKKYDKIRYQTLERFMLMSKYYLHFTEVINRLID